MSGTRNIGCFQERFSNARSCNFWLLQSLHPAATTFQPVAQHFVIYVWSPPGNSTNLSSPYRLSMDHCDCVAKRGWSTVITRSLTRVGILHSGMDNITSKHMELKAWYLVLVEDWHDMLPKIYVVLNSGNISSSCRFSTCYSQSYSFSISLLMKARWWGNVTGIRGT